jgi:hypothetical protein
MTDAEREEARRIERIRRALYEFTFKHCTHNDGSGHAHWLTCWRCAVAFFETRDATS